MSAPLPPPLPSRCARRTPRRPGQGLVEFALILPLLLFVLFGIIEFARILQAWLSVENAARFGVRYAVTGEYSSAYCPTAAAELQAEDPTRFANIGANDLLDGSADCVVPSTPTTLSSYQIQTDALKDRARLYSIKEVATGAAVAILNNPAVTNETDVGFFKVTICSTRNLDGDAQNQPDFTRWPPIPGQFLSAMCVMDPDGSSGPLPFPVREVGPETMDPGGPGDRVIVTVDFNHPVIVPLISSLWPKLHLTSLRQGIVERFRVARVVGLPPTMVPPTNTSPPTDTPTSTATPTDTPTPTETATPTQTPTPTATATETLTPTPTPTADCSQSSSQFSLTNFILTTYGTPAKPLVRTFVNNASAQNTTMDSLVFIWAQYRGAFASAVITAIRFDGTTITSLFDTTSPTSWSGPGTQALDAGESDALEFEYRTVDPNWPGNTAVGYFGLTVTLGNGCVLVINALPTNTPTITQTPSRTPSPTITLTPSQTPTPTQTRTPTATVPTPTPTQTRTPTATVPTSTPTVTSAPTATPTPAPSRTPTATVPTPTQTDSPTPTATVPTPTRTNTPNVTRTPTATQTQTPTKTPTPTLPCLDC